MERELRKILNLTAIRDDMEDPPKAQRMFDAFDGQWEKLSDEQIVNIREILNSKFAGVIEELEYIASKRGLFFD